MKKITKFSATLLSVSMFLSALPSAYAFKFSGKNFSEIPIDTTTKSVTASITANNPDSSADAVMVATATDKTTKKLVGIGKDDKTISSGSSTLTSTNIISGLNQTTAYDYDCFVWDSILNHFPLRNTRPTMPNITDCHWNTNSLDLQWDEPSDDKAVKGYKIEVEKVDSEDNVLKSYTLDISDSTLTKVAAANPSEPRTVCCSLFGLDRDSSYLYKVFAYDEEGLLSKAPEKWVSAKTSTMQECILHENNNSNIVFDDSNHDSPTRDNCTEYVALDSYNKTGREYFTNNSVNKTCFFHFAVNSSFISKATRKVAIEVTYLDKGTGNVGVQYNALDGSSGKSANICSKTDTGAWRTAHILLEDAMFVNSSAITNASFRIQAPKGTGVYKVALCNGGNYSPDAPNVKFSFGYTDIYDLFFYQTASQSYNKKNNVPCMTSLDGSPFEFDIQDDRATSTSGYVEVTYFDEYDSSEKLVLNYNNAAAANNTVAFGNTSTWKTVQIPLENAELNNGISGANSKKFDFTLSTNNASPLSISSVKYVPGNVVEEVEEEEPEEETEQVPETDDEIYALVNVSGKKILGSLTLDSSYKYGSTASYDSNILLSGNKQSGMSAIDNKHYMYNQEYTEFASDKSWQRWKNAFYFKIPDTFISGVCPKNVEIEVECYMPTGQLQIELPGGINRINTVPTDKWTTTKFVIKPSDSIAFSNSVEGCDFRMYSVNGQGYIHKVTVRKTEPVNVFFMADDACAGEDSYSVGWGNVISNYFASSVSFTNYAEQGHGTQNYNNYYTTYFKVGEGDYVFIQFGHNDTDVTSYKNTLTTWITELKAKGAIPILLSPTAVQNLDEDGYIVTDDVAAYRTAMKEVADDNDVLFIDVYSENKQCFNDSWAESTSSFYTDDNIQLTANGAEEITKIIVKGIKNSASLSKLAAYIDTTKSLEPSIPPAIQPPLPMVYAEVKTDGTGLTADSTLELNSAFAYGTTNSYDNNILFSGNSLSGKSAVDNKHYMFNQEYNTTTNWKKWANSFYFNMPDDFVYGQNYEKLIVSVECYAPSSCDVKIVANNASGEEIGTDTQQATNEWKTLTFEFTPGDKYNFTFKNYKYGCDFRIQPNNPLYIRKVTVSKPTNIYLMSDDACEGVEGDSVGWGSLINKYFDGVNINDYAEVGASTKSYNSYSSVKAAVKQGDYVLIQFGYNDSRTDVGNDIKCDVATYKANLKTWIRDIKKKGAVPILLSPTAIQTNLDVDSKLTTDAVADYRTAMKEVADEKNVPFIDVYAKNKQYYNDYWTAEGGKFYAPDGVQLMKEGATEIAKIIVSGIKDTEILSNLATLINTSKDLTPAPPSKPEVSFEVNADAITSTGDLVLRRYAPSTLSSTSSNYNRGILFSGEDYSSANTEFKVANSKTEGKAFIFNVKAIDQKASGRWKNAFYFDIPDTFLSSTTPSTDYKNIEVEIECYAPDSDVSVFLFVRSNSSKATDNDDSEKCKKYTSTTVSQGGQWQTIKFTIDNDITFDNGWKINQNDYSNIKIATSTNHLYIHKVTVKKVPIEQ